MATQPEAGAKASAPAAAAQTYIGAVACGF